ncbi:unnamed protein product [Cunninghamella blakesleeana]
MADTPNIPLDIELFQTLEARAMELSQQLSDSVELFQERITNITQSTVEAGKVYTEAVHTLSNDLATCTQKTIELITQCDELDKDLTQIQVLSKQIKEVDKRLTKLLSAL